MIFVMGTRYRSPISRTIMPAAARMLPWMTKFVPPVRLLFVVLVVAMENRLIITVRLYDADPGLSRIQLDLLTVLVIVAVSYTHLDVYKRQVSLLVIFLFFLFVVLYGLL